MKNSDKNIAKQNIEPITNHQSQITINLQKKLHAAGGEMLLNINAEIRVGQIVALYGTSGAGKTSTLRMLAGLMQPDSGYIQIGGKTWFDSDKKVNFAPQKRNISYMFQDYALFPNMTVRANLEFAQTKNADKKQVDELIEAMQLGDLQHQFPTKLSGGQQQRVALARTLVRRADLLLLDEPLSALDQTTRLHLQDYLLEIHRLYKSTIILVSHDIGEVFRLANRVLMMENGEIVRTGSPLEVFAEGNEKLIGRVIEVDGEEGFVSILIGNQVVRKQVAKQFLIGQEVTLNESNNIEIK